MGFFNNLSKPAIPLCIKCTLDKQCNSPRMGYVGTGKRGILIIGNASSPIDDIKGELTFDGDGTKLLQEMLHKGGVHLHNDCFKVNALGCCTLTNDEGEHLEPTDKQLRFCKPRIDGLIQKLKPKKIILLGKAPIHQFYLDRQSKCTVTKFRGLKSWDSKWNCWVFASFHPVVVGKKKYDELLKDTFRRDIVAACQHAITPPDIPNRPVQKLVTIKAIRKFFAYLLDELPDSAFDYETTSLKPFKPKNKIVSIGVATKDKVVSFPYQHPALTENERLEVYKLWKKFLKHKKIKKIVHNMVFEYSWSAELSGQVPRGMYWDTQLAAHVLDNRSGILSLKFQAWHRWGIEGYEDASLQYIKSKTPDGMNTMLQMPLDSLLQYNGEDAMLTFALYKEQQKEFIGGLPKAYRFFHDGLLTLCEVHRNGIRVDNKVYKKSRKELADERDLLLKKLANCKEARKWKSVKGTTLNIDSGKQLQELLYDIYNIKSTKKTTGGGRSVDVEVLNGLNLPFTNDIVAVRKINKALSTYIDNFAREEYDNRMHPFFGLHRVQTYRSSSSMPNFQNIPKRDPRTKKIIRTGLIPNKGSDHLLEIDYSGAEVATSACYHLDENFITYLRDKTTDMHRDCAKDIWLCEPTQITKPIRQDTKGGWTFAQFYGSYYKPCAELMWATMLTHRLTNGVTLKDHMYLEGIVSLQQFTNHVEKFEKRFWGTMFPGYAQWKKDIVKFYRKHGYIETFFGFRFTGYMNDRECCNYPIQGTSFHLLLFALTEVQRIITKRKMRTRLIGQIHDSIISNTPHNEVEEYIKIVYTVVSNLQKTFKWMIVPMEIEVEMSKMKKDGGNFAEMNVVDHIAICK